MKRSSAKRGTLTDQCPICKTSPRKADTARAVISPWIRDLGIQKFLSHYSICNQCEMGFFKYRYSSAEMEMIYAQYRGEHYVKTRQKWEPWYSETYNSNHDAEDYISKRREVLGEFIQMNTEGKIKKVVDVGGDRGQYIPELNGAFKYVLEVSNKKALEGVSRIRNLHEVEDIDLIIYSHVLEHVVDPILEIKKLIESSIFVYVEVPFGVPVINRQRKNIINYINYLLASLTTTGWRARTSPSTGRDVIPMRVLTQSEHINFFTETSLKKLAQELNLDVTTKVAKVYTPDFSEGTVIQCLFRAGI